MAGLLLLTPAGFPEGGGRGSGAGGGIGGDLLRRFESILAL